MRTFLTATETRIFLPDTVAADVRQHILKTFTRLFGGATVTEGVGTYVREDTGTVDYQNVEVLSSFVPAQQFDRARTRVEDLAEFVLDHSDEEVVLWTYGINSYLQKREEVHVPQTVPAEAVAFAS